MDAMEFIEKDLHRGRGNQALLFAILFAAWPVVFGLLTRGSYGGVFLPRVFVPNLLAATALGAAAWLLFRSPSPASRFARLMSALIFAGSLLAVERVFFPPGERTVYGSFELWRHDALLCFLTGSVAAIAGGALLALILFRARAWPTTRTRMFSAAAAGVVAAVTLGFHCDSSSPSHVAAGHLLPGLAVGLIVFIGLDWILRRLLAKNFPELQKNLANWP